MLHRISNGIARATAVLALIAVMFSLTGCGARETPKYDGPLVIGATTLPGSAPVYVARDKGLFAEQGLDVRIKTFPAGRLALEAAQLGEVDVALVAQTPVAKAVLDGHQPVLLGSICRIEGLNMVIGHKDRGVRSAADLAGKRVGVLPGTSADFFLHIYLVVAGVDPSSVEVVPLETETLVASLVEGDVDAIAAFAPYSIEAIDRIKDDAVVLEQPGLYVTSWNAATTRAVAEQRRPELTAFLRAVDDANGYIVANPEESQRITAAGTKVPLRHVEDQWDDIRWGVELDQSLILSLEDEYRWMADSAETPDFLGYIDPAPLRAVDPSMVTLIDPGD